MTPCYQSFTYKHAIACRKYDPLNTFVTQKKIHLFYGYILYLICVPDLINRYLFQEAFHLQVDSSMYSMEIEQAGQILNVWTEREARSVKFGEYQNNGKFKVDRRGLYYIYSQVSYLNVSHKCYFDNDLAAMNTQIAFQD